MKRKREHKVSLVVLNYNGIVHLNEYFKSVYKQTRIPDEVIMMDNNSSDGSVEFVKKSFPKVRIIKNSFNAGTAGGSNVAFSQTTGDLVVFQSNDLRLDNHCIEFLVKALERDSSLGIVTSVLLNYYQDKMVGEHLIDNAGGIIDVYGFGMQKYPFQRIEDIPNTGEVFFSYGGSFIIRAELFKRVGGFDSRFFTLNDDIDLSWRVRLLGLRIIYDKRSIVYHKVSATLGPLFGRPVKRYWSERNILRTLLKDYSLRTLILILPQYFALLAAEVGYFLFRGKFSLAMADAKAVMWNIFYLPETILLRRKVQHISADRGTEALLVKGSFKLQLFDGLQRSL